MTSTGYQVLGISGFERANLPDTCQICGRESLVHPVKIGNGEELLWTGTGCAANLLYGRTDKTAKSEARKAAREAQAATDLEEQRARFAAQRLEDEAWQAWLDEAAGPGDRIEQIRRLGGITASREAYRAATS